MADEDRRLDVRVPQHDKNGARVKLHFISNARFVALAMTGQIDRDHSHLFCQRRRLLAPYRLIATPAVHEDQRGLASAIIRVMNLRAIQLDEVRLRDGRGARYVSADHDKECERERPIHVAIVIDRRAFCTLAAVAAAFFGKPHWLRFFRWQPGGPPYNLPLCRNLWLSSVQAFQVSRPPPFS